MTKLLMLCVTLLGLPASAAFAQIDLTWDNCVLADVQNGEPPPTADKTFACMGSETYRLHGSFKPYADIPDFIAMDIRIGLAQEIMGDLVPFYHYETGGCNASGITFSVDKSVTGAEGNGNACALFMTPWGDRGEATVFADIVYYAPDYNIFPGRGRLLAAIARSQYDPVPLQAARNYYAFHLTWTTNNGATCAGCGTKAAIGWDFAILYSTDGGTLALSGPYGSGRFCVTIQTGNTQTCLATPIRNTTWGQLKSIYR